MSDYGRVTEVLDNLPALCRKSRHVRRLSLRAAADEMGVSFNTLSRFERGKGESSVRVAVAVLRWLDAPVIGGTA